ncbi:MAG: maleylpyruvate isomerase N-terminal domain-containing protein [Actinomycetota bacterium]
MAVSRTGDESAADRPDRDLRLAREAHTRLVEALDRTVDSGGLDAAGPSRLPDWTRGHVLTHLARNADSHRRMFEGAAQGDVVDQYEGGAEGRDHDIEAGSTRAADELVEDVRSSATALEAAWQESAWSGGGRRTLAGSVTPLTEMPFLRLREVWVHLVDLDVGVEFEDLDGAYVRLELRRREMTWRSRLPMGMSGLPQAALALDPPARLAWLMGRRSIPGLDDVTF